MCLFVITPLLHGSVILSTNQRTACVAQTYRHPIRRLSTPTKEYCETSTAQYGSVWVTPTFVDGTRSVLHLKRLCTFQWKCPFSTGAPHPSSEGAL